MGTPACRASEPPWGPFLGDVARAGDSTVVRLVLGALLRRLREAQGISRRRAGEAIRVSEARIGRIELGRIGSHHSDVAELLSLYGVHSGRVREALLTLVRQASEPDWWQRYNDVLPAWFGTYIGLEQAASTIRSYQVHCVPGLFQIAGYARAVIRLGHPDAPDREIDQRVELRLARQDILEGPKAPRVWMVVDEAALRRPFGGSRVMRDQLTHLLKLSELPSVTLQTVPFHAGGQAAADGPFILLRFPDPHVPDLVYLEQLTSALYLDRPADVDVYTMMIDRLSAVALSVADTRRFLLGLVREL